MKPKLNRFLSPRWTSLITLAYVIFASNPSHAATLNWDGANAGGTDDVASGGTGNWNTALSWDDGLANSLNASWSSATPDSAVFGGAAGTVTVSGATTAGTITFNTAGYTLNNTSTLTAGTLAGSGSFTKTGAADLIFNVGSTFTGGLTVAGGKVFFNNPVATTYQLGSLTTGNDILVDNASTLQLNNGVLNFGNTNFWIQTTGIGNGATTAALGKITSGTGTLTVTNAVPDYNSIGDQAIRLQIVDGPGAVQLVKNGGGALRIDRANTYTGGTVVNAGKLELQGVGTLGTGAVTVNTGGQVMFSGTSASFANNFTLSGVGSTETAGQLGALRFGSNTATITGTVTLASDTRIGVDATGIISGAIGGGFGFEKTQGGTLTLSGANTYSGATTVRAGTLSLDYDTQDNSKIAGALILTNGTTLQLSGATGTHSEALGSFSSSGVTTIARNGTNTAVIELGNFTNTGLLNVGAVGLATTTKANNAAGYLNGVLLAGTDLAMNSGGNVVAFTGYNDVTRLSSGAKVITSGANTVTRIIEGTGAGANITVAAGTTDIQSLLQTATGAATVVDLTGGTLRLGASGEILTGVGSQALTIQGGSLTAGGAVIDTAGEIFAGTGVGGGAITITSGITNNGTGAVSLRTAGTVNVTGDANLFSGGTTVTGGTLTATATTAAGAKTTLGAGAINVNNGTIRFSTGSTSNALSYANAINLTNGTLSSNDGVVTYGGLVSLTGVNTLNAVFAGKNAIFSNTISGSGSIIKNGNGDVILNGNNTYTGGTNFNGGSLQVGNAGALGISGALTFTGGTLKHTAANTTDYSSRFSTAGGQAYNVDTNGQNVTWATGLTSLGGSLTKLGTGTLTLTGTNTYNSTTTIRNGTVSVSSIANNLGTATSAITLGTSVSTTGALLYTGAGETAARGFTLNGNGVITNNGSGLLKFTGNIGNNAASGTQSLTLGGSNNGELSGVISNNGTTSTTSLIKTDAGTWTLAGISTYTGGTTVNNGVLNLNAGGAVGAIRGTATVNNTGVLRLSANDSTGYTAATALNVINLNNGGTLDVATVANQTLGSAVINMTGGNITGIAGSNLDFFGGASALNTLASSTTSIISGVRLSALRQGNTTFTVADGAAAIDLRIDSVIQNSPAGGVLTKAGAGLMQLTGVNTFTGNIAITGGILELGGAGVLGSGNSAQNINNNAAFVSNSTANQTLSGAIIGSGTLKKSNTSTLTLTGTNLYTGTTTVSSGTLRVNGSLANTTTTVESGGTLGGVGSIAGFTTIQSGGRLSPGNSPGVISFSNGLELQAGGNLDWEFTGNALATRGTDYDGVNVIGGVFTLGNAGLLNLLATGTNYADAAWDVNRAFKVVDVSGAGTYNAAGSFTLNTTGAGAFAGEGSWSVTYDPTGVMLNWTAVPEPSVIVLGGLGMLVALRRRRSA